MQVVSHLHGEGCVPGCGLGPFRNGSTTPGVLAFHRPQPTAAFSRRDRLRPGYPTAQEATASAGYAPWDRLTGGRFAAYDSNALVVDLFRSHSEQWAEPRVRFERFSGALRAALRRFDDDVRVGEVPGEFCPGEYSLNVGGRTKVVGVAQRVTRHGWLISALLNVNHSEETGELIDRVYAMLDYEWDRGTYGALGKPGALIAVDDVASDVQAELTEAMGLSGSTEVVPAGIS